MKRVFFIFSALTFVIFSSSCREDFETELSTGRLEFSQDTVFLDTVFTNIGTATYSFKVYNRSDDDISVPSIRLASGAASDFRLNVNGAPGTSFTDIPIFAKDSIFIFVESTTDVKEAAPDESEFLLTEKVLFDTGDREQEVDLVTLVKDATFLFPALLDIRGATETLLLGQNLDGQDVRIQGFVLDEDELLFTNDRPYVIYGYALVPNDATLTIEAGARIHFHENSGLLVANRATLNVNGAPSTDPEKPMENEVVFQGDRLGSGNIFDEDRGSDFTDIPGQWAGIWLLSGATTHTINHATILNSTIGLFLDANISDADARLKISNTQIYNNTIAGIIARNWNIEAENVVIGNSGQASLNCAMGGTYSFKNCTFTNYWRSSSRMFPTVLLGNRLEVPFAETILKPLVKADFLDCIIYGNDQVEIGFDRDSETAFNFSVKNTLLRFDSENLRIPEVDKEIYDVTNTTFYQSLVLNENPEFKDVNQNDFKISDTSPANGKGTQPGSGTDILGKTRSTTAPDLGAYESTMFEDED